jgi:hypothetical protein
MIEASQRYVDRDVISRMHRDYVPLGYRQAECMFE